MKNILFYIITAAIFLAPYKYLEQDNVNGVLFAIIAVFSIDAIKNLKGNKKYSICLLTMTIISGLSLFNTCITLDSMQGLALYIGAFLMYFIFVQYKDQEELVLKIITYIMAAGCIFYIVIQGAFYNGGILEGRIDGNIGYANTYALLMVAALYINSIRQKDKFKEVLDLMFIEGVLLTGSRNTLLYLGIFVIASIIYEKKKHNVLSLNLVFNCITAELIYLIISKLRLGGILLIPIIVIVYFTFVNAKNRKTINIMTSVMIPIGIIEAFTLESNLFVRISSASVNSSELQQRIGYLEDVISYVFKNPFGGGLNTYMYNQGFFQTGFYDVRYVHNSFGQALYDMGFLGLIAFTLVFIAGIFVILKGKNKNMFKYLLLYLTIYLHSILDFDFAYMVTLILVVMTIAFAGNDDMNLSIKPRYLSIPLAVVSIYVFLITGIYYTGSRSLKYGRYEKTLKAADILENITFKDNNSNLLKFDALSNMYKDTGDLAYLQSAIDTLEGGERNTNKKSYVYAKLSAALGEAGDVDKSSLYYEKSIELQRYSVYPFNAYCDMLTREGERNGCNYEDKKTDIMNRYYNLQNERSEKSKKRFQ